jgi:hypothetical protein
MSGDAAETPRDVGAASDSRGGVFCPRFCLACPGPSAPEGDEAPKGAIRWFASRAGRATPSGAPSRRFSGLAVPAAESRAALAYPRLRAGRYSELLAHGSVVPVGRGPGTPRVRGLAYARARRRRTPLHRLDASRRRPELSGGL